MGFYHLPSDEEVSELFPMSLLFGTCKCDLLSQGVMPVVHCFHREMSHMFSDLDFVKVCLGDVLTHSNNNEEDHMEKPQ